MHIFKKTISGIVTMALISSFSISSALTNKESIIDSIDTLNISITTGIAAKEKTLSDRANELGNRYDSTIISLGFQPDEIEALTSIKRLNVPSFRQDIAQAYLGLKQSMLQDIKSTQTWLSILRDEVALGYTDLSLAQRQSYDNRISDIQGKYSAFLSGSSNSIDTFVNTFSGRIASDTGLIAKMMRDNSEYVLFIRNIRYGYARIEEKKTELFRKKDILEKTVLPRIQGGFLAFTTNKKTFTDAIRKDLASGLEKAMLQERIRKQETELRAYMENIMSKWNEHLRKNFWQDDELIAAIKDLENAITLEKTLHGNIYDISGNIRSLDISGSGTILQDIAKTDANLAHNSVVIGSLISLYGSGNTLSLLNDRLTESYMTELTAYRADFTKLLEERLNTAILEERSHSQILALLSQEEEILKHDLETATTADFAGQLVTAFRTKITALAKADGGSDVMKKASMLEYRYIRAVTQKKIENEAFVPYYGLRTNLDAALSTIFTSLENKVGKDTLLVKFPIISGKIDTLLLGTNLSAKKRYSLLVVQSNILKYLEDATK